MLLLALTSPAADSTNLGAPAPGSTGTKSPGGSAAQTESAPSPRRRRAPFTRAPAGRNSITASATFPFPELGVALGYDRVVHRRFTVGGTFEYELPTVGYGHLVGISETLRARGWVGHPHHGLFGEASLTFAHQVHAMAPSLSLTTIAPGLGAGFRYTAPFGLTAGVSGGLRWGLPLAKEPLLCTRAKFCGSTRLGAVGRLSLDVGWVF